MRRKLIPAALAAACGIGLASTIATTSVVGPSAVASASPAAATRVPAHATARVAKRPARILSLSASATQMLYAIGAGAQVVGVDKYSTYPPNAPRTAFTGYESSAEDYLPERPDLVILAFSTGHLVEQLRTLHIRTLVLAPARSIAAADHQLVELGATTGHLAAARAEIGAVAARLQAVVKAVGGRARGKSYYIEIDPTLYTATSKTFVGALFSRLGMRDIADPAGRGGSGYPQLSAEYLVKANPDYVFLADTTCCGQRPATFAGRPGFSVLRAVRHHHVVAVADSLASEWGPHSVETFFTVIARAVTHPGAGAFSPKLDVRPGG